MADEPDEVVLMSVNALPSWMVVAPGPLWFDVIILERTLGNLNESDRRRITSRLAAELRPVAGDEAVVGGEEADDVGLLLWFVCDPGPAAAAAALDIMLVVLAFEL